MADNVAITAGAGTAVAADDVSSVYYQKVKLDVGGDGATVPVIGGASASGLLPVGGKCVAISQTPTIGTGAYVAKDAVGGLLEFANAARVSGGSITVDTVVVVDKAQVMLILDLVLFNVTLTAPTDSSVFDPTDAELATCIGVVPITTWADFSDNSMATRANIGLTGVLNGTSLFGVLVARSGGSLTNGDITVIVTVTQN
jgi:hypothetical protein